MAGLWLHSDKRCSHNLLVVQNGISRSHQRITFALVGKNLHSALLLEACEDILLAISRLLHIAETVRVTHCSTHNLLHLLLIGIDKEGLCCSHLLIHCRLDHRTQLLDKGSLSILLHRGVDCRVYLQTISVDVILRTVGLAILMAPTIKRILLILLARLLVVPRCVVVATLRRLSIHNQTQHLTEVCRLTVVVRDRSEVERDRQCRDRVALAA